MTAIAEKFQTNPEFARTVALTATAVLVSVGSLLLWACVAPGPGSGWLLLVALIACIGLGTALKHRATCLVGGGTIAIVAFLVWFYMRNIAGDAGFVGLIALVVGIGTIVTLRDEIATKTSAFQKAEDKARRRRKKN